MKKLSDQLKNFLTNRIGLFLVTINFILAISGIRNKGWSFETFHFFHEPLEIKILSAINLPAILLAGFLNSLFYTRPNSGWSQVTIYDFEMVLIVIFSIFQWLMTGYLIDALFFGKPRKIK